MKLTPSKSLKKRFVKQMAMLLSICYLVGPFQEQISSVLHELAHSFEMPTSILSHDTQELKSHAAHELHHHENQNITHEHTFIDLVNTVIEASNEEQESDKTLITKIKLKKHITLDELVLPIPLEYVVTHKYFAHNSKPSNGHFYPIETPPKYGLI